MYLRIHSFVGGLTFPIILSLAVSLVFFAVAFHHRNFQSFTLLYSGGAALSHYKKFASATSQRNSLEAIMMRTWHAWINLVKAMAGVGIFALPVAFQQAGLWVGTILTFILGVANAHCMIKLVKCSQYLSKMKEAKQCVPTSSSKRPSSPVPYCATNNKKDYTNSDATRSEKRALQDSQKSDDNRSTRTESLKTTETKTSETPDPPFNPSMSRSDSTQHDSSEATQRGVEELENDETSAKEKNDRKIALDYGDMAKEAFITRGPGLRFLALPAKIAVNFCLFLLQLGICSVFYIFVSEHIREMIEFFFGVDISVKIIFVVMVPFFILLTSVQNVFLMSCISLIGNVLITIALAIVLVKLAIMPHIPLSELAGATTISSAAMAAGSITYAYAGQAVVLPLENQMRHPKQMLGFLGVISTAVAFVGVLYAATAILGYITYGSTLKGSITLNLSDAPLDFSVKVMLLLMTYCGYLIQHYPIFQMIWPEMQQRLVRANKCVSLTANYTFRYVTVILSFLLALSIPNLEEIIPIIGVTTGMLLAFVFPAVLESVVFWKQWRERSLLILIPNIILNTIYTIVGILFLIVGVYANIIHIISSNHS